MPSTRRTTEASRAASAVVVGAVVVGAVVIAAAGLLTPGTDAADATALAPLVGAALLLPGPVVLRAVHRAEFGRFGAWGAGVTVAGLVATVAGSVLNLAVGLAPEDAGRVAAAVAAPAWILAHLVYVGGTLLGVAAVRTTGVPRPVAVALTCSLPLLLLGVPGGLALDPPWSTITTWIATEGQVGIVWLLVAAHLRRASGRRTTAGARLVVR